MQNIAKNVSQITALVEQIRTDSHRNGDSIKLLAASKGHHADNLLVAWRAGIRCFGESYLQEALQKQAALLNLIAPDNATARNGTTPEWHFIGPIQANKTRNIAKHFSWVHSIDRLKVAERLSLHRQGSSTNLNVCIQVNIDREASKAGVAPEETLDLAKSIARLPNLRLRGLMVIPKPRTGLATQREPFRQTAALLRELKISSPDLQSLDTLSMGMSDDMAAAIAEGATIVRIGRGIFGSRPISREGRAEPNTY